MAGDKELRTRVKLLGKTLGDVFKEQSGDVIYDLVEQLRMGYIDLHQLDNIEKRNALTQQIEQLDSNCLIQIIRAFSNYFNLVSLAEELQQHKNRRRLASKNDSLWQGSFEDTIAEFKRQNISPEEIQILLNQLTYIPVFTAHPTEAKRRTVLELLRKIFITTEQLDDPRIGKRQRDLIHSQLKNEIQTLWKTDEVRTKKPSVLDEVNNGLYYFRESLFDAIPIIYSYLSNAIHTHYPDDADAILIPSILQFGSWIGGDRDGNPHVTPEVTISAVRLQSREILTRYIKDCKKLSKNLTQSTAFISTDEHFDQGLEDDLAHYGHLFTANNKQFINEPYRKKLCIMIHKLQYRLDQLNSRIEKRAAPHNYQGYKSEKEFYLDLQLIHNSLCSHGDADIAAAELSDLLRLVETFGFYLQHLDVRQESTRHTEAIDEILQQQAICSNYQELTEQQRLDLLSKEIRTHEVSVVNIEHLSERVQDVYRVFPVLLKMRKEISPEVFGSYVISMTHTASQIT